MSNNTLVRGAAVAGLVVCTLAAGGGVAFAASGDATACTVGAANYPDCTPTTPPSHTGTNNGGGPSTYVPPAGGVTTVVAGGTGTTESSGAATSLPFTGFEAGAAAAIGLAALGAGSIFIVASRRRRSNGDSAAA